MSVPSFLRGGSRLFLDPKPGDPSGGAAGAGGSAGGAGGAGGGTTGGSAPPQSAAELAELRAKLAEFRDNNVALKQQLEQLTQKYGQIDLGAYQKALKVLEQAQGEDEKKLLHEGKFDELFNRRVTPIKEEFQQRLTAANEQLAEIRKQRDSYFQSLAQLRLRQEAQSIAAASRIDVRPEALDDFFARVERTFSIDEKTRVQPVVNGQKFYGSNGEPLTMKEFVSSLLAAAPHLFKPGTGGGASGGSDQRVNSVGAIDSTDTKGFLANIDKIAKGEMAVRL